MLKYIAVLLVLVGSAMAQSSVIPYPGVPSGTCAPTKLGLDLANGHLYACNNGTWLEVGPGAAGAAAWNTITSGTNAGQTLTVGNGTTLATTGTGVINANQLGGKTFAVPAAIGSTTPAAGTFTALTANTSFVLNGSGTLTSVVGNGTKLQSTAITAPAAAKCVEVDTSGVLQIAASNAACGSGAGGVTSVALAGPTGFQISGSPVTTTGTLTLSMPASWTTGDLLLGNGANSVARLAIGSNATCLTSNGTTASWGSCSAGSGTVTVVGAGALTSTAFVTGGGTTTLQTPSATSTLDASGNANFAGTVTAGGTGGVVPSTAGVGSLGATSLPFQYLYLAGASGTPASQYALFSGSFTGIRTFNLPDSNTYLPIIPNVITITGPTAARSYALPDASTTILTTNAAVTVAQGGTGLATLTAHAVQVGAGTSNVVQVGPDASTTKALFSAGSSADPAFRAIAAGDLPAVTVTVSTSSPVTVSTTLNAAFYDNQHATAGTAMTFNLPTAAAGKQFCFKNSYNGSAANTGALTIATSASGQFIIDVDGTLGSTGGNVASGGAGGDGACVRGVDATHWQLYVQKGTWTKS